MRIWACSALKLLCGMYFVLTSVYALLASLPFTYYSLTKEPAYSWMPWFVHLNALLFWVVVAALALVNLHLRKTRLFQVSFTILGLLGLYVVLKSPVASLQDNSAAYWVAVLALWPIILVAGIRAWEEIASAPGNGPIPAHLPYTTALLLAACIALVYATATKLKTYSDTRALHFTWSDLYFTLWSAFSHFVILVILISFLNLLRLATARSPHARAWRWGFSGLFSFAFLWAMVGHFLQSAFSLQGWQVQFYSASFAAALALLGISVIAPLLISRESCAFPAFASHPGLAALIAGGFVLAAFTLQAQIGGEDWNGLLQGSFALVFWVVLGCCIFSLRRRPSRFTVAQIFAVLFFTLFSYKALQATEILWARPLGQTDDDIQRALESYGDSDISFNLAHHLLGNGRTEPCEEACRLMRSYTNIPNAKATFNLKLVDRLVPAPSPRPNIFFIVVDSLRGRYLGAYNKEVNFTPNLDAFAKESLVIHHVFSPYAGSSLSEPAIWAGALLLHAHFMQPFSRVNSIEKLARADGYQMILSEDNILEELVPPSNDIIRLDKDKAVWRELELCSTLSQLESVLEQRPDGSSPVFFYAQPKNVHQFAENSLPSPMAAGWQAPPGFNYRISYEVHFVDGCLGSFFSWLKAHGLYDNSIIIVTSDHGDATGEYGRVSHSLILYPEIMRVPLLIHLPASMRAGLVYDDARNSSLTDIAPSLYYLLGHRPILHNPIVGRPLFASTLEELHSYPREELLLASDVRAAYGILTENSRYFYATYDLPAHSYLFDLRADPQGLHDILTPALKSHYDREIIDHLHTLGDFYGYRPGISSLVVASNKPR